MIQYCLMMFFLYGFKGGRMFYMFYCFTVVVSTSGEVVHPGNHRRSRFLVNV